ncbi:MAG: ComEC/Rec2 family competence protein [bacterium]|nr:ComEC/Rec2 family competence protein [bacterium]
MNRYPSLIFLGFVVIGIALADRMQLPAAVFVFLSLVAAGPAVYFHLKKKSRLATIGAGLVLLFFSGAHFGFGVYEKGPDHLENVVQFSERYHIFGQVADWPEFKGRYTQVKLRLDSLGSERFQPVHGTILLKISDSTTGFQRGDRLELWGRIHTVSSMSRTGEFDYGRYLSLKGISGVVYQSSVLNVRVNRTDRNPLFKWVDQLRESIKGSFARNLSPEAAALASGFLIGETRDISPEIYQYFRDSGTLHLLAVSGSNVAMVIMFFLYCFRWMGLNRLKTNLLLIGLIVLFAILSYGEPSVVRASVMASLILMAQLLERRYNTNNIIAGAALIILLYSPAQLFDVGFQLSFVTAWGLILSATTVERIWGKRKHRWYYYWLVMPLCLTLAAQLFSAPLIALYFHQIPLLSLAANLVIIPLVSIAVVGIMLLLAADLILPFFGQIVGGGLESVTVLIAEALEFFGASGAPMIEIGQVSPLLVLFVLGGLVAATLAMASRVGRRYCLIGAVLLTNVVLFVLITLNLRGSPALTATVARSPGGTSILLDGSILQQPDLILTGLDSRDYPVDERILDPFLRQYAVTKLGRLVLFGAGFEALDDIMRLAGKYAADSILLPDHLLPSFKDALKGLSSGDAFTSEIVSLGEFNEQQNPTGAVEIDARSYSIDLDHVHLRIIRFSESSDLVYQSDKQESVLIAEPDYLPERSRDQTSIDAVHHQKIISCAKYEQMLEMLINNGANSIDSSNIFNLNSTGPIRIEWDDSFAQPVLRPVFN